MKRRIGMIRALLGVILPLLATSVAQALNPGDILVIAPGGSDALVRIDPTTGTQTVVSSGGFFVDPVDIAIAPNGQIFVADLNAFGGSGGVIRVDPATGAQTAVSSGGFFVDPFGIAIGSNGDILVVDTGGSAGGRVIRIDPATGAQTVVSSDGLLVDPFGVAIAPNGDLLIADPNAFGIPPFNAIPGGAIFRVNPTTGAQTLISSGGVFFDPSRLVLDGGGQILVTDFNSFAGGGHACGGGIGALIRVNPTTGSQTIIAVGGPFTIQGQLGQVAPFFGVAVEATGDILVGASNVFGQFTGAFPGFPFCGDSPGAIFRVNPTTGTVTLVSFGGLLDNVGGIAVVPPPSVLTVMIDIKPGSFPNSINPRSRGTIPVAILSSSTFDAPARVDRTGLTFGRTGDELSLAFCNTSPEDVNGDGFLDQVCHFNRQATGFQAGDTEGILKGLLLSGVPFQGTDSVRIVQ